MALYAAFVTFRVMGRDYDAAVLAAGHVGFALSSTAAALAIMKTVTERRGPSPLAFVDRADGRRVLHRHRQRADDPGLSRPAALRVPVMSAACWTRRAWPCAVAGRAGGRGLYARRGRAAAARRICRRRLDRELKPGLFDAGGAATRGQRPAAGAASRARRA